MNPADANTVTRLLNGINSGEASISDLLPIVYQDLRSQAAGLLRRRNPNHTLQVTSLVNEVAGRLLDHTKTDWSDRAHFFAVCARAMRQVLTDHARRRNADKRGNGWQRISLDHTADESQAACLDLLVIDEALGKLNDLNNRMAQVVECRFFAGMSNPEIARVLSVSVTTVENDWRTAKAWLSHELRRDGAA